MTFFLVFSLFTGLVCLHIAKKKDQKNYIIQKATPMQLSLANVRDDVWLKGTVRCVSPVNDPFFHDSCLFYRYKKEEKRERIRQGKREKVWVTVKQSKAAADFDIIDGAEHISVRGEQAEFKDLQRNSIRDGKYRHTTYFYPYPSEANAVGCISEDKKYLEPHAVVPLLIMRKNREEYIKSSERSESFLRGSGFVLLFTGLVSSFYIILPFLFSAFQGDVFSQEKMILFSVLPSVVILIFGWAIHVYNRMISFRNRIDNAWRQVDVDLVMRYNLIPQLVQTAKGYMAHEKNILEHLTDLRAQANNEGRDRKVLIEGEVVHSLKNIWGMIEKYPDLKSNPLIGKLNREMVAIEEKIAHGRIIYNEAVREYNTYIQVVPTVWLSGAFAFKSRAFFDDV